MTDDRPSPMRRRGWSITDRAASFRDAFRGAAALCSSEPHAIVHLLCAAAAVGLGAWAGLSRPEWAAVVLAIGLVFVAEAMNTAIERLADAAHPGEHPLVGRAKDLAAGGVLLASLAALAVGGLVLLPAAWGKLVGE